jgi:hypothetical protein
MHISCYDTKPGIIPIIIMIKTEIRSSRNVFIENGSHKSRTELISPYKKGMRIHW